ncbi:MAG: hypothetical protein K8U57_00645, partial [Planctomycetes bacterium]|nr:hypothetical protein [Planctomycetota bacterium]
SSTWPSVARDGSLIWCKPASPKQVWRLPVLNILCAPLSKVIRYGEGYSTCCPFCRDRGFNLNVNHRYGTVDERLGGPLPFLATCFAHRCLTDRSNRAELFARLDRGLGYLATARIRPGTPVSIPNQLPGGFQNLTCLPEDHVARIRLRDHGFDPDKLGGEFGVGYCGESEEPLAVERIVAPVVQDGGVVGWLAVRFVNGEPRFLRAPGMRTTNLVYNLDQARAYATGFVVPSPDWVWRLGMAAMAPLTQPASDMSERRIHATFQRKKLVLVTPPAAKIDRALESSLRGGLRPQFRSVILPSSAVGANRKALRRLVSTGAAEKGLNVKFTKPEPDSK